MKYKYNSSLECFERYDENGKPRGKKLWVNIMEARKIITLYDLGNSVGLIQSKMTFSSKKASGHTVGTIIKLYEEGDIELDGNYPIPSTDFDNLNNDIKIENLEARVEVLEKKLVELENKDNESFTGKVKSWISH